MLNAILSLGISTIMAISGTSVVDTNANVLNETIKDDAMYRTAQSEIVEYMDDEKLDMNDYQCRIHSYDSDGVAFELFEKYDDDTERFVVIEYGKEPVEYLGM